MSPLAFYRDLLARGIPEAMAYEMAEKFEADRDAEVKARVDELLDRLSVDVKAEARKAKDRARKAAGKTGIPRNSAETAETTETPPSPALSPQTPQTHPHPPGDINTRVKPAFAKSNGFARFWEAYPNKVGKAAAERAYAKAVGKIGGLDPPAVLLAGVERAKASREWLEGYIPHPTTWLNQGRWDDQPAEQPIQIRQAHERPDRSPDAKLSAREENYARAFAGSERAARSRWVP